MGARISIQNKKNKNQHWQPRNQGRRGHVGAVSQGSKVVNGVDVSDPTRTFSSAEVTKLREAGQWDNIRQQRQERRNNRKGGSKGGGSVKSFKKKDKKI